MRILVALVGLALVSCSSSPVKTADVPKAYTSAAQMPVEEFFRNPEVEYYVVSPDGKQMALLRPWKTRQNIFVHPVDNPKAQKQITYVEDRDLASLQWKGPNRILFTRDFGGDENYHIFMVDLTTGEIKDLTPFKDVRASIVDTLEDSAPDHILIAHNQRDPRVFDLYRVDLKTGTLTLERKNENNITDWLIDHSGRARGGVATDGVNTVLYFEKTLGKPWVKTFSTNFRNSFDPVDFTADGKRLFAITNLGSNLARLVEFDPARGKVVKTVYQADKFDVSSASYSLKNKTVRSAQVITEKFESRMLRADDQSDWKTVQSRLPGRSAVLRSTSLDEDVWVIKTFADVSQGEFYLFKRASQELIKLADLSPWLKPELMSETKPVYFKSRDGLSIPGYLTLPRGIEAKNLPVVMVIHGGPWARDIWRFDPEAQFLASRGYAVMNVNFRGSTGYGRKFWEASFKQWGLKMQDDVTDAVRWLVKEDIADAKKVCIYGGSYGGYATLAGLAFTPDLYACGVDYVGPSNIFTLIETIPPYWEPMREMFYAMVGHPVKDKVLLRKVSPVFHADKIRAPLFVAQGANDPRVKKAESDQIVEALQKRGVAVEYMLKENEGHGFHNEENRFDFYRAMEKFLAKHLKAQG